MNVIVGSVGEMRILNCNIITSIYTIFKSEYSESFLPPQIMKPKNRNVWNVFLHKNDCIDFIPPPHTHNQL
jgi:hypothetical protein